MPQSRLTGLTVLLAEDNLIVALDLEAALHDSGARVAGPAVRVEEALSLVAEDEPHAAILDFNLLDGAAVPVLEWMVERGLPVVICTGAGLPEDLVARFPDLPVFMKPTMPERLVEVLAERLGR
ncbi:response regulator [Jiella sp. M17.18]|uniref:response regulator n=1 Tax=Jiella sp. M17.18 TaxID=3234247 RepID=UPI0034E03924